MRFSERIGKTQVRTALQMDAIDDSLKIRLWNAILEDFFNPIDDATSRDAGLIGRVCKHLWTEFFKKRIDQIPKYSNGVVHPPSVIKWIEGWYFKADWYQIYDFIEEISSIPVENAAQFIGVCNLVLEKEMANYRIVDSTIVQITSEQEIIAIEEAINADDQFKPVHAHLKTALDLLSNRTSPDYRNSIKESISALESLCKILVDDEKASLGKALAILEAKEGLHTSLKEAFSKIYGYSSDAGGIRHAMLEDNVSVDFEDAKFMLVLCSSFINYLRAKFKV